MSLKDSPKIYIAMGGNLGDVIDTFHKALRNLGEQDIAIERVSSAYQTQALVAPGVRGVSPPYWNTVIEVSAAISPFQLLKTLLEVEEKAGRLREERWASRTLDLDLLLYGDQIIDESNLQIPHPRMFQRVFVMRPLAEIAADFYVASAQKTIRELLALLPSNEEGVLSVNAGWFDSPLDFPCGPVD